MTGDDDTRAQFDRTGEGRATGLLDVLLAELEADDGPNAAALRWALDLDPASSDLETDLERRQIDLRDDIVPLE